MGGYIFMFCPNVILYTYAVLNHILGNLPQIHCHGQTNHSQQEHCLHLFDQVAAKAHGSGFQIYTDRFHTSMLSAKMLQDRQMHLTGTEQKIEKFCPKT